MRYLSTDGKVVFEVVRTVRETARASHYMFRTTGGTVTKGEKVARLFPSMFRQGDPEFFHVVPLSDEKWADMVAAAVAAAEVKVEEQIQELGLSTLPEETLGKVREGFMASALGLKLPEQR